MKLIWMFSNLLKVFLHIFALINIAGDNNVCFVDKQKLSNFVLRGSVTGLFDL